MLTSSAQMQGGQNLEVTTNVYNSLEEVTASTIKDQSGNVVSLTTYGYDETTPTATSGIPQHVAVTATRGNQTSSHIQTGGSTIDTTATYYDTGVPIAVNTPNGTTSFGYDSTQTFPTSTVLPTPSSGVQLATSANFDQQSGALISATGMNANQTYQAIVYDSRLRPVTVYLPNSSTFSSYTPNQTGFFVAMGNGSNTDTETQFDAYGRKSRVAIGNGQASNPYYQTDYCYDGTGLLSFQSIQYQGAGWATPKQCSGNGTSYDYDALGRVVSSTNADGTSTVQYQSRAVRTTDSNGVQKITQYDLLGRISGICEISSNGSPTACGMDIAGTGFVTAYAYNLANHTTTITQGAQQRVFQTDEAGRTIYTSEPERGATEYYYAYNSQGLQMKRMRPTANQTNPATLTATYTQYDTLGRVTGITYSDGTNDKYYTYDMAAGWNGSLGDSKGLLIEAQTASPATATQFAYDAMGNVIRTDQCLPSTCGNGALVSTQLYTYDLAGHLTGESDPIGGAISYGRSPAGEVTSITNGTFQTGGNPANLVSNVANGPQGPVTYALGNGLSENRFYDGVGRLYERYVCTGSIQRDCAGGTETYASIADHSLNRVTAFDDTALFERVTFGYDEFNRLTSANVIPLNNPNTVTQTFAYSYDRYGNRLAQNAPQGGPAPSYTANPATNQIQQFSYDAAGNLLTDGIHTYTYDAEGNVLKVDNGTTAQYVYDAFNHRVEVETAGSTSEYTYDYAGRRIETWNATTNTRIEGRIYWDGNQIAFRASNGTTFFEHQDFLGTERVRTDSTGAVAATYTSLPWGDNYNAQVANPSGDQDSLHFATLDHDVESGTDHAQFRQYSNMQGRWMSPDPYDGSYNFTDPQSFNRYSYVLNSPLAFTDPSGQKKPVLLNLQFGGGGWPIIDGNTSYFGSGWDEFQPIMTVSSQDGDGSYSYTQGAWSSIAGSDTGNTVNPDGTITSNSDGGLGGNVTSSLLGLMYQGSPSQSFLAGTGTLVAPNNGMQYQPQKTPSKLLKYVTFLGCELNNEIAQLTGEEDAQTPMQIPIVVSATAVVGALNGKLPGWTGVTGAITGSLYAINIAGNSNKACSPGYFAP